MWEGCLLTMTVRVPIGLAPLGEVMVPVTVTGAFAVGLGGVTVCVVVVGLAAAPTARFATSQIWSRSWDFVLKYL